MSLLFSSPYAARVYWPSLLPAEASFYISSHTVWFEKSAFTEDSRTHCPSSSCDSHCFLARFPHYLEVAGKPLCALKTFTHDDICSRLCLLFFKLIFPTSLIDTAGSGGHLKLLFCLFLWLLDEDFQTGIVCMEFFYKEWHTDVWPGPEQRVFMCCVFHGVLCSTGLH